MRLHRLIALAFAAATPAWAQPIIIPLQSQDDDKARAPVASAPPVAPPVAPPSLAETGIARGADTSQQEQAQAPEQPAPH